MRNNPIIKIATVTLFSIMIIAFIALKSGCISINTPENVEEESVVKEEEFNISFRPHEKTATDTVAIQGRNDFAIVDKKIISSSKSMMVLEAEEIISIINGDALPKNFKPTSDDTITAKGYDMYLEMQKKEKEEIKVIIPSSKSAPIFQENSDD